MGVVEIVAVEVKGVGKIVVKEEAVVGGRQVVLEALGGAGPTSPDIQITLPIQSVKNIMFLGNLHIGVKSQQLVHGRITLYQKISLD